MAVKSFSEGLRVLFHFALFPVSVHFAFFEESLFLGPLALVRAQGVLIVAKRVQVDVLAAITLFARGLSALATVPLEAALWLEGPKRITIRTV